MTRPSQCRYSASWVPARLPSTKLTSRSTMTESHNTFFFFGISDMTILLLTGAIRLLCIIELSTTIPCGIRIGRSHRPHWLLRNLRLGRQSKSIELRQFQSNILLVKFPRCMRVPRFIRYLPSKAPCSILPSASHLPTSDVQVRNSRDTRIWSRTLF